MSKSTAIVWIKNDLRLADNPALAAARQFDHLIPLFIYWPGAPRKRGAASNVWLHHSLTAFEARLNDAGARLCVLQGNPHDVLLEYVDRFHPDAVFWNRSYDPDLIKLEDKVQQALKKAEVRYELFQGNLLLEPWNSRKKDDTPYLVYTPFAKSCMHKLEQIDITPKPQSLPEPPKGIQSDSISKLRLLPEIRWDKSIVDAWDIGEEAASKSLRRFLKNGLRNYEETRNLPALDDGVSRLSPHLHFGEITPRQVWAEVNKEIKTLSGNQAVSANTFLKELLWREFSHHLLYHFPSMPDRALRKEFERYPWDTANDHFDAWQRGRTGYPIVDAGLRQLWETGWMHNRVRMIVGSFLIKDLNIDWRTGEEWFWDTLVDADLAQNAMNWQWVAGCGADASPFFRIFNPTSQGKKFDPEGDYVSRWVPELAQLPAKWIHVPHEAPADILREAGVKLGETYPHPIVDHGKAREEALAHYKRLK